MSMPARVSVLSLSRVLHLPAVSVFAVLVGANLCARFFDLPLDFYGFDLVLLLLLFAWRMAAFSVYLAEGFLFLGVFVFALSFFESRNAERLAESLQKPDAVFALYGQVQNYPLTREVLNYFVDCRLESREKPVLRQEFLVDVFAVFDGVAWVNWQGRVLVKSRRLLSDLSLGDLLQIDSYAYPVESLHKCEGFDYPQYLRDMGLDLVVYPHQQSRLVLLGEGDVALVQRLGSSVRNFLMHVYQKTLPGNSFVFVRALIFGEKEFLPENVLTQFQRAGVFHVLAVSGLHVGFIASVCFFFCFFILRVPKQYSWVLASLGVVLYAVMVGYRGPVFRATVLFCFAAFASLLDKEKNLLNLLCLTGIVVLFWHPDALFLPSFQLSFVATLGIALFFHALRGFFCSLVIWVLGKCRLRLPELCCAWGKRLLDTLALTLSAQSLILPLLVAHFQGFSVFSVFANLVCVGIVWFAVVVACVLPVFAFVDGLSAFFAGILSGLVELLFAVVKFFSEVSFAYLEVDMSAEFFLGYLGCFVGVLLAVRVLKKLFVLFP